MTLAEIVEHFTVGWREHIEWLVKDGDRYSKRSDHRMQPSLMQQLKDAHYEKPVVGGDSVGGSAGTKVHADIPGNLEGPDEILVELWEAAAYGYDHCWEVHVNPSNRDESTKMMLRRLVECQDYIGPDIQREIVDELLKPYRRARLLLGYDDRWVMIDGTVCGDCDGQLRVERTQPKVVRCCECPRQYHWLEWIRMASA